MTMVYATPDQLEALTMGDNITIINEGKFIQKGTPDDFYDNPDNIYVGKMIGSPEMNITKAKINSRNNQQLIYLLALLDINEKNINKEFISTDLSFGIRPNDINITNEGETFDAKIFLKEPLGDVTILDLNVNETN